MELGFRKHLHVPIDELAEIYERFNVQELALFGSVLREDFHDESDIDVLVTYRPGTRRGYFEFFALQEELERLLGRKVDLVPRNGLKPVIRDIVLASAEVVHAA